MDLLRRFTRKTEDLPGEEPKGLWRRRLRRALVLVIILGPAILASLFVVAMPARRIARQAGAHSSVQSASGSKSAKAEARPMDEPLRRLHQDEAYWKSRVELAKSGTIHLAVDLIDSTMTLEVRGVPIRECKIKAMRVSRALAFSKARDDFRERFSRPLTVKRETATLPKEPIRVEIAPKDTTEAALAAMRPLAPEVVDVYFTWYLEGNLALSVSQLEKPDTKEGARRKKWMDVRERTREVQSALYALIRSDLPRHEPRIEVTLLREDAKAIYRALGPETRIALRL